MRRARTLLAGLWLGLLLTVALIATPAPFAALAAADAGRVVARVLASEAYASLALAAVLFLVERRLAREGRSAMTAALMLVLGALATLGHLMFTSAYREASAATLAPVNYLHIAFATVLGWAAFAQIPDAPGFTGMALIAVAGLIVAWQASR